MSWSQEFVPGISPSVFYPELNLNTWTTENNSVNPVTELDRLINRTVARINEEGKKINPEFSVTLNQIRSSIPGDFNSMTYEQRFNTVVNYGQTRLTSVRNNSVNDESIKNFYSKYYFSVPTNAELNQLKQNYLSQDYGFGSQTKQNQKIVALNRSIQYGLVPESTSEIEFEAFVSPSNRQGLINRLLEINGTGSNAIISPGVIQEKPEEAAYALLNLRESGKLEQNNNGTYKWTSGNDWKSLANINNGNLLNQYQKLIIGYEKSDSAKNGISLSQYIANQNRTEYDSIKQTVESQRINVDTSKINEAQAKNIVERAIKDQLGQEIATSQLQTAEQENKINQLRLDAFKEAQKALIRQEQEESFRSSGIFNTMNDMFDSISRDLGVKEGVLRPAGFQSNISFNWQNWFEDELRKRYDPASNRNVLGTVIGNEERDRELGTNFIQQFLQRRFDGSKSLSEFVDYLNPGSINPVLEQRSDTSMQRLTSQGYEELMGSIENPSSVLGNFWTNLQSTWARGRSFDFNYYLNQSLGTINNNEFTVNQLHNNIKEIHNLALQNNSIYFNPEDIKNLNLIGVNKNSNEELNNQIGLYQNWFNKAYASGVNLLDEKEFAKLHYDSYLKNSTDPNLFLQGGRQLLINNPDQFTDEESKRIFEQVQYLTKEANQYLTNVQFGVFKTPEEYISEMINKSGLIDTSNSALFTDAGLSDVIKDYIQQFSGVLSSYAGEMIRNQIRNVIDTGKIPTQQQLGVDYIQRTKEQALSTIRSLISKDAFRDQVIINDAPGPKLNESFSSWFSNLGLELIPGKSWDEYKNENNINPNLSFKEWEQTAGDKQKEFWNFWASQNNVQIIEDLDPNQIGKSRITIKVDAPTPAWIAWAKRISTTSPNDERLDGASIKVATDAFNTDWYSKTNPYTKIKDEWNKIVSNPNQSLINLGGKSLGTWAKESGLNPEEAWIAYRNIQQQQNSRFGKDAAGSNLSFVTWSQNASQVDLDRFWRESNQFWFDYLKEKNVIQAGTAASPEFKTWNQWAIENRIPLNRVDSRATELPPGQFMELHYYALGGAQKINEEYLKTYFPEFSDLERQGIASKGALASSPFDLSSFGLRDDTVFQAVPITSNANRTSQSPIDFAMQQMFGDSMSGDSFDLKSTPTRALNDFGLSLNLDTSYNKKKSGTDLMDFDFGFGSFGGSSFGF